MASKPRRQERRARGRQAPRSSTSLVTLLIAGAAVLLVGGLVYRAVVGTTGASAGPRLGDHWHAPFRVVVCGERLPPLPATPGDIHSHGDDVIHIHPSTSATTGRNATLAAFLATTTLRVTASELSVGGRTYRNGDTCPDGRPGRVSVLVNGRAQDTFLEYVPRDGDRVEFVFGP